MMNPVFDDLGDEEDVAERVVGLKRDRDRELSDLRSVLNTPQGRRFIARLLTEANLLTQPPDGPTMARFVGRQDVARWVLEECLTASPRSYILMQSEALDEIGG